MEIRKFWFRVLPNILFLDLAWRVYGGFGFQERDSITFPQSGDPLGRGPAMLNDPLENLQGVPMGAWYSGADMTLSERIFQSKPAFGLSHAGESPVYTVQENGTVSVTINYWFRPPRGTTSLGDFTKSEIASNLEVLNPEVSDTTIFSPMILDTSAGVDVYNFSVTFTFDNFAGTSDYALQFRESDSGRIVGEDTLSFIVGGITLYETEIETNGNVMRRVVTGQGGGIVVNDYRELLQGSSASSMRQFGVVIQFLNGTRVESSSFGGTRRLGSGGINFNAIGVSLEEKTGILVHDLSGCPTADLSYAVGTVAFDPGCSLGFFRGGPGQEYNFGLQLSPYRSGKASVIFDFFAIADGFPEFQDVEIQNTLDVRIGGTVPPLVLGLNTSGPFLREGGEYMSVFLANAAGFENAGLRVTNVSTPFLTLANSFVNWGSMGSEEWRNTMQQLRNAPQSEVEILSVSSQSVPAAGGTTLSIRGYFEGFDKTRDSILISGVRVNPSSISASRNLDGTTSLTFTVPKYTSGSFAKDLQVVVNNIASVAWTISYVEATLSPQILSMSESVGLPSGGELVSLTGNFDFKPERGDRISFGGKAISDSDIESITTLAGVTTVTFLTPPHSPGAPFATSVEARINGRTTNSFSYSYYAAVIIYFIFPSSGPTSGGNRVTLAGNFRHFDIGKDDVLFDGVPIDGSMLRNLSVVDGTAFLEFEVPPHIRGSFGKDVSVRVSGMKSNVVAYSYISSATVNQFEIINVGNSTGPSTGGSKLSLIGNLTDFDRNGTILIDGVPISNENILGISSLSDGRLQLEFIVPPLETFQGSSLNRDVQVWIRDRYSNVVTFAYSSTNSSYSNFLRIEGLTPDEGGVGSQVTLKGNFPGFNTISSGQILINGVAISSSQISSVSETSITFTIPMKSSSSNAVDVQVSVGNIISSPSTFTYASSTFLPTPSIYGIYRNMGSEMGGTTVIIRGNFKKFDQAVDVVRVGGIPIDPSLIQGFSLLDGVGTLTFVMPPNSNASSSAVDVSVSVDSKSSNAVTFTYTKDHSNVIDMSNLTPGAPFTQQITLRTSQGSGENLPWSLAVTIKNQGSLTALDLTNPPALISYFSKVLVIQSITPASGPVEGGNIVNISGKLPGFDKNRDALVINNRPVEKILSVNEVNGTTTIVFEMIPYESGPYTQSVQVIIGSDISSAVSYTYQIVDFSVDIEVVGGQVIGSNQFRISGCFDSRFNALVVPQAVAAQNITYLWIVTNPDGVVKLSARTESVAVLQGTFETNKVHDVTLLVRTPFANHTKAVTVTPVGSPNIGVSIVPIRVRSIGIPNAPLRVSSIIKLPTACYKGNLSVLYTWTFRNQAMSFSSSNVLTDYNATSPTRLGRELTIVQRDLSYGTWELTLAAVLKQEPSITGSDTTTFTITPAALVAQINSGESRRQVWSQNSLEISGRNSRDPDVLPELGDPSAGLSFLWTCQMSSSDSFPVAASHACPESASTITGRGVTISPETLQSIIGSTMSGMYLEYTLMVSKSSKRNDGSTIARQSRRVRQVIQVLPNIPARVAAQGFKLTLANPTAIQATVELDRARVPFYFDLMIQPLVNDTQATWRIILLEPKYLSGSFFLTNENLLSGDSFYSATNDAAQSGSLGLRASSLSPSQTYKFEFTFSRADQMSSTSVLSFSTVDRPELIFPDLALPSTLSIRDEIVVAAFATFDMPESFYFFYLERNDTGASVCVGGCDGNSQVSFSIPDPGRYRLRCSLVESTGSVELDSKVNRIPIVVEGQWNATSIPSKLQVQFDAGNHIAYEEISRAGAFTIDETTNISDVSITGGSEIVNAVIAGLERIVMNSIPSGRLARNYGQWIALMLSLGPEVGIRYPEDQLRTLFGLTRDLFMQTPALESPPNTQTLLSIYNLTLFHATQVASQGTTRRRLLQVVEIKQILLDVYEQMKLQFPVGSLKDRACGYQETFSTSQSTALTKIQGLRDVNATYFVVGVFCSGNQGNLVRTAGTTFKWCQEAMLLGSSRYFGLISNPDYILNAGIGNASDTVSIVTPLMGDISYNQFLNNAPSVEGCYVIDTPIQTSVEVKNDTILNAYSLLNMKLWGAPAELTTSYERDFQTIVTGFTPSKRAIRILTNRVGTFGAAVAQAPPTPELLGPTLAPQNVFNSGTIVGIVTGLLLFIVLAIIAAWIIATRCFIIASAPPAINEDYTYVERDIYGRGAILNDSDLEDNGPALSGETGESRSKSKLGKKKTKEVAGPVEGEGQSESILEMPDSAEPETADVDDAVESEGDSESKDDASV